MDLNKLKSIADKLKQEKNASAAGSGEWPNVAFIPDGTHKGRFIVDPNDEVYTKYFTYGYFSKGIRAPERDDSMKVPDGFDRENHPLRQAATILVEEYKKFSRGAKFNFLVYFYLISTDKPSDDWKPNTLYCLLGNGRFADAFTDMLTSLVSDSPEHLLKSLSPDQEGPIMQIVFQGGPQGKCSISPTFSNYPPIVAREAGESDESYKERIGKLGYKPLEYSYIKPGFDQAKYDALLAAYLKELEELSAKSKSNSGQNSDSATEAKQINQASDDDPPFEVDEKPKAGAASPAPAENTSSQEQKQPEPQPQSTAETAPPVATTVKNDPFQRFRKSV